MGHAEADYVARQQRLAGWQVFQLTTQSCLEQVVAVGGETLAKHLAEAIRRERERSSVSGDRAMELVTGARYHRSRPCSRDQTPAAPGGVDGLALLHLFDNAALEAIYYSSQVALFLHF